MFGVRVSADTSAKDNWTLHDHIGGMLTAGVGGSIMGYGAHVFVLDDIVKNAEQAFSTTIQERNWDWYQTTVLTRLEPEAGLVYIQTRWHELDLGGRILTDADKSDNTDPWITIVFPELAEEDNKPPIEVRGNIKLLPRVVGLWIKRQNKNPTYLRKKGDALWPWRWSLDAVLKREAEASKYRWAALHQQNPISAGGLIFQRDYFTIVPSAPIDAIRCRFWDCAGTADGGDYTVGALVSYEPEASLFFIEDIVRAQLSPASVKQTIRHTAERDGYNTLVRIEQEPGSSGKMFIDEMHGMLTDYNFGGVRATGKKELRWDAMTAAFQHQRIVLVDGEWNKDYIEELEQLPAAKHDDQADASAGAYNELLAKTARSRPRLTIL